MRSSTFTTYINAREEPGAYAAFDKLAQVATARYATVTRAANEAARAAAGITGGRGSAGLGAGPTRDVKLLADTQRVLARASADTTKALTSNSAAVRNQGRDAKQAAGHNQALANSLRTTATVLGVVQGPLGPLAGRVSAVSRAVEELTGFRLGLAGLGTALFAVGQAGNNYTLLQSKLRPFFDTQQQSNRAFSESIRIAQRSRAPLEAIVDLYGRLNAVGPEVGIDPSRVGRITEVAAKAATLSGGTAQTQQAGLGQFLQGIGSNNLAGDELKSVKENTFALAQAIAAGFKNADGSIGTTIGNLKELGSQGKLTAGVVADALERSADDVEKRYARLPLSLNRAATGFENSLTVLVGRFDSALRFTSGLAAGLDLVANNLNAVAALGAGLAARLALPAITSSAKAVANGVEAINQRLFLGRQLVEQADEEWKSGLNSRLSGYQREGQALERQQQRIKQNIDFFSRLRAQAQVDLNLASGDSGSSTRYGAAYEERAQATKRLVEEQRKLVVVENALAANGGRVVDTQQKLAFATENCAKRMGFLRTAAGSLVSFLGGPWGIALTAATIALTLFATAQSAAEKATARNEAAQRSFEAQVDQTTGKINGQIGALQRLSLSREQGTAAGDAFGNFKTRGNALYSAATQFSRPTVVNAFGARVPSGQRQSPAQRELAGYAEAFRQGKPGSFPALESAINRLAGSIPGLKQAAPRIGDLARDFRTSYQGGTYADGTPAGALNLRQAQARQRVVAGQARPDDLDVARGGSGLASPLAATKPKSRAQLAAEAAALAAQTDLQRARAEEAKVRANGKQGGETDDQYVQRLGAAIQQVRALTDAEKEQRKARSAGAVQARKEARDAQQDALDAAARQRDASLLTLVQTGADPKSIEFLRQREAIIKTYQDEVNAIDASRAASNAYASEQVRNAEKVAAQATQNTEKRSDVLGQYVDQPKAVTRASDQIDDLEKLVGQYIRVRGELIEYTRTQFDADAKAITDGLRRPFNDYLKDRERDVEISRLVLQGREAEAEALRTAYGLYDAMGALHQADYELLVRDAERQQHINDLLASRERIVGAIQGVVDNARDSFENFLVDLPTRGSAAFGDLFRSIQTSIFRVTAAKITESIFAGSDDKVRSLLSGRNSVDQAIHQFNGSIGEAQGGVTNLSLSFSQAQSGATRLATALQEAAKRIDAVAVNPDGAPRSDFIGTGSATGAIVGGALPGLTTRSSDDLLTTADRFQTATTTLSDAATGFSAAVGEQRDILVLARRESAPVAKAAALPDTAKIVRATFGGVFDSLDAIVNQVSGKKQQPDGSFANGSGQIVTGSKFFANIGKTFSDALSGAGKGAFASAIAGAVGIPQNSTGASIGGAVGGVLAGIKPIAAALGPAGALVAPVLGVLGGLFGALFAPAPRAKGGAITNTTSDVLVTGNNADQKNDVSQASKAVQTGIQKIADSFNADLGAFSVSISKYKSSFRVDPSGGGSDGGKYGNTNGVSKFDNNDAEAAIRFAIRNALQDGAIKGIREGSQRLLQSGKDLDAALQKALSFEQVFKDLKARTDPVAAAIDEVNLKFNKLKAIFAEAGASAQEYADLTKLYEFERADAIKTATDQASAAINQFLKDMVGSSASPLNKQSTYQNAAAEIEKFKSDIGAGKSVDQNDLLSAARNFQDASRALNGSSQSFFADFDALRNLLIRARDNASPTGIANLPASPLANDPTVQAKLAELQQRQIDATNTQTGVLSDQLGELIDLFRQQQTATGSSALGLLPGFGGGGGVGGGAVGAFGGGASSGARGAIYFEQAR